MRLWEKERERKKRNFDTVGSSLFIQFHRHFNRKICRNLFYAFHLVPHNSPAGRRSSFFFPLTSPLSSLKLCVGKLWSNKYCLLNRWEIYITLFGKLPFFNQLYLCFFFSISLTLSFSTVHCKMSSVQWLGLLTSSPGLSQCSDPSIGCFNETYISHFTSRNIDCSTRSRKRHQKYNPSRARLSSFLRWETKQSKQSSREPRTLPSSNSRKLPLGF